MRDLICESEITVHSGLQLENIKGIW